MKFLEKSITVHVPANIAYNQWTQFEEFPRFMEGIREVRQLDDKRLHWRAEIGGCEKEWEAEIVSQVPDQCIAWRSTHGTKNSGLVSFHGEGPCQTRLRVRLEYEPEGRAESFMAALGIVSRLVESNLKRFKRFIEKRGVETGAWRGEIGARELPGSSRPSRGSLATPAQGRRLQRR